MDDHMGPAYSTLLVRGDDQVIVCVRRETKEEWIGQRLIGGGFGSKMEVYPKHLWVRPHG